MALTSEWFQAHVRCSVYFCGFSSDAWSSRVVRCGAAMFLMLVSVLTEVCFTLCIHFFVSLLKCYTFVFFTFVDFLLSVVISCLGKSCSVCMHWCKTKDYIFDIEVTDVIGNCVAFCIHP